VPVGTVKLMLVPEITVSSWLGKAKVRMSQAVPSAGIAVTGGEEYALVAVELVEDTLKS
jgi:hypothetical protein